MRHCLKTLLLLCPLCVVLADSTATSSAAAEVAEQALHAGAGNAGVAQHARTHPVSTAAAKAESEGHSFTQLPREHTGIDFKHFWDPPPKYEEIIDRSFAGGGVAIGDYDGDGLPDVYLSRPFGGGQLYRNLGEFRFENVTQPSGLASSAHWSCGATFVDVDNDSDLDLFVCGYDCPNRLYINQGDGSFKEEAESRGVAFQGASVMMAFADYDRDGDLDGLLVTNRFVSEEDSRRLKEEAAKGRQFFVQRGNRLEIKPEAREIMDVFTLPESNQVKLIQAGQFARLYRNDGRGFFKEVAREAGISDNGLSLSATWWDYNDDGWPDLYLANDFYGPDRLYRNNQDGTFTDVVKETLPHVPWYSMGTNVSDVNNDGLLDFFATDMAGTTHYKSKLGMGDMSDDAWFLDYSDPQQYMRNALFINSGAGRFFEAAHMAGVANSDWTWSPKFGDFDCDGKVDLFISNGMTRDWFNSDAIEAAKKLNRDVTMDDVVEKRDKNLAFRNAGDLKFKNVGQQWGLDQASVSFGAAMGDLDADGDLDLIVNNFEEAPGIFRNDLETGNWIKFALRGGASNSQGIDSRVTIYTQDFQQTFYLTLARGFMGNDESVVHFGLGDQQQVEKITIRWPSGQEQTIEQPTINQLHLVEEPSTDSDRQVPEEDDEREMFAASDLFGIFSVSHQERQFDDFAKQPLLPNRLSQLGPGIAMADVDGDDACDFYLGGAAGRPGQLMFFDASLQEFEEESSLKIFAEASEAEDMGSLFFDADGDGDLDLYVVSGGVECEPGDEVLQDRLYLNQGKRSFEQAPLEALPDLRDAGSCVVGCDFDRDGDVDLFVGGRSVPGEYPSTPFSRLLRNDSTKDKVKFSDVTEEFSNTLLESGMVTAALWSDVNNDGWNDLLVAHEWGPIKLYLNESGSSLVEKTEDAGLSQYLGWWNGITGGDVDNDGDIDYVVTNFGLNTKYHPSPDHPVSVYYGDFEDNGRCRIVEAKHHDGTILPVRGKSCSQNAMPFLREKFPTYNEFASAVLPDIYSTECLNDALELDANCLESGVLLNDGQGHFSFVSFPRIAQIAPGFGVQLVDVNNDGSLDVYMVQNFFSPQRETGHLDGGLSQLLLGRGDGRFDPVTPKSSGLVVPQDAKSVVAADFDRNGQLDLLIGVNDGDMQAFESNLEDGRTLRVNLPSLRSAAASAGARVVLHLADQKPRVAECYYGAGYLSQSPPEVLFGLSDSQRVERLTIRWADGSQTEHFVRKNGEIMHAELQ